MNRRLLMACLALLVGVQLVLVAHFSGWFEPRPTTPHPEGGSGASVESLPSEKVMEQSLPDFFKELGAALRANDGEAIADRLDVPRFRAMLPEGQALVDVLKRMAVEAFPQQALLLPWRHFTVGRVQFLDAPGETMVDVHHRALKGESFHMRWWLKYSRGVWRFYDWENRELGERFSAVYAIASNAHLEKNLGLAGIRLQIVDRELKSGNVAAVEAALKLPQVANVKLPDHLEVRRWMLAGAVDLFRGRPQPALEALARAEKFAQRSLPGLERLRGRAYNALGEYARALIHINRYAELFGEDAQTQRDRGVALAGSGRIEEAVAAFQKASAADPAAVHALLTEKPRPEMKPLWEVEVKWSAGDGDAVIRLLNANRKGLFGLAAHQDRLRGYLVRSLVRLKRFDEARKEAEGAPLLSAVVYAASEDVDKTIEALKKCDEQGRSAADYHADPDLGPLLRSPLFARLHRKYPAP